MVYTTWRGLGGAPGGHARSEAPQPAARRAKWSRKWLPLRRRCGLLPRMKAVATPPLQQQLRGRLHARIDGMKVGDRLPSERDLAEEWGVARMTVRRVVGRLVTEGVLERRHGSGTYVVPRPRVRTLGLTSFHADMAARGLVPGTRVLSFRTSAASPDIAGQLRVSPGEPIYQFTRLRLGSGNPIAVETTWLPERLAVGLRAEDLRGSLYQLLSDRYSLVIGQARVAIDPVLPDGKARELLQIGAEQACLRIRMVDFDDRGRAVMVAHCLYRGDQYHLAADVTGAAFRGEVGIRTANDPVGER